MDIYRQKSNWKIYLGVAGVIVVLISLVYTRYLADRLAQGEKDKVALYSLTMEQLINDPNFDRDIQFEQSILELVSDVPVILVQEDGSIYDSRNIQEDRVEEELEWIKENGPPPLKGQGYASLIYFKHTRLLTLLTYFPFIQILLLLAFVGIGYIGFSTARRAEQNQVWVGMAKETAHQLGTPISAIIAWIEHLREMDPDDDQSEIIDELRSDVNKLELIADRFSKIGSAPELVRTNLRQSLLEVKDYISRRAPRGVDFVIPDDDHNYIAEINPHLFTWVVENIMRNALDAIPGGKGTITIDLYNDKQNVYIDITDTGKGIPSGQFKQVFQPGFTTKSRGWGLGLSLAKRIIENYHKGKIYVKRSIPGEATTLTIELPQPQKKA
ncbi:MAG: HAMP domain-containing sensor histidine kinase [Saprospiraceae bacterium]|nr:HAMP domain-containing sensor histidine kinase [Saprospiraceae bacterium]